MIIIKYPILAIAQIKGDQHEPVQGLTATELLLHRRESIDRKRTYVRELSCREGHYCPHQAGYEDYDFMHI